jgi:hypothetical protein
MAEEPRRDAVDEEQDMERHEREARERAPEERSPEDPAGDAGGGKPAPPGTVQQGTGS